MIKYKTRPIGEVFKYNKLKLQVQEKLSCKGCYFENKSGCLYSVGITGCCSSKDRNDHKDVIFKQIFK